MNESPADPLLTTICPLIMWCLPAGHPRDKPCKINNICCYLHILKVVVARLSSHQLKGVIWKLGGFFLFFFFEEGSDSAGIFLTEIGEGCISGSSCVQYEWSPTLFHGFVIKSRTREMQRRKKKPSQILIVYLIGTRCSLLAVPRMQTKPCIFKLLLRSRMWLWEDLQFIGYLSIKDWGTEHFLGINDWLGEPQAINPCLPLIFRKCPAVRSLLLLYAERENNRKKGPCFIYLYFT